MHRMRNGAFFANSSYRVGGWILRIGAPLVNIFFQKIFRLDLCTKSGEF